MDFKIIEGEQKIILWDKLSSFELHKIVTDVLNEDFKDVIASEKMAKRIINLTHSMDREDLIHQLFRVNWIFPIIEDTKIIFSKELEDVDGVQFQSRNYINTKIQSLRKEKPNYKQGELFSTYDIYENPAEYDSFAEEYEMNVSRVCLRYLDADNFKKNIMNTSRIVLKGEKVILLGFLIYPGLLRSDYQLIFDKSCSSIPQYLGPGNLDKINSYYLPNMNTGYSFFAELNNSLDNISMMLKRIVDVHHNSRKETKIMSVKKSKYDEYFNHSSSNIDCAVSQISTLIELPVIKDLMIFKTCHSNMNKMDLQIWLSSNIYQSNIIGLIYTISNLLKIKDRNSLNRLVLDIINNYSKITTKYIKDISRNKLRDLEVDYVLRLLRITKNNLETFMNKINYNRHKLINGKDNQIIIDERIVDIQNLVSVFGTRRAKEIESLMLENKNIEVILNETDRNKLREFIRAENIHDNAVENNKCPHTEYTNLIENSIKNYDIYQNQNSLFGLYCNVYPKETDLDQKLYCNQCNYHIGCQHEKILTDLYFAKDVKIKNKLQYIIDTYYAEENIDSSKIICKFCGLPIDDYILKLYDIFKSGSKVKGVRLDDKLDNQIFSDLDEIVKFIGRPELFSEKIGNNLKELINDKYTRLPKDKNLETYKEIIRIAYICANLSNILVGSAVKKVFTNNNCRISDYDLVNYIQYFDCVVRSKFPLLYKELSVLKLDIRKYIYKFANELIKNKEASDTTSVTQSDYQYVSDGLYVPNIGNWTAPHIKTNITSIQINPYSYEFFMPYIDFIKDKSYEELIKSNKTPASDKSYNMYRYLAAKRMHQLLYSMNFDIKSEEWTKFAEEATGELEQKLWVKTIPSNFVNIYGYIRGTKVDYFSNYKKSKFIEKEIAYDDYNYTNYGSNGHKHKWEIIKVRDKELQKNLLTSIEDIDKIKENLNYDFFQFDEELSVFKKDKKIICSICGEEKEREEKRSSGMTKAQQKELHNRVEEYNTQNVAVEYFKIRCLSGVAHNFVGGYCTNCGLKTETVFEPSDKRREFLHKMYLKVRKDEKKDTVYFNFPKYNDLFYESAAEEWKFNKINVKRIENIARRIGKYSNSLDKDVPLRSPKEISTTLLGFGYKKKSSVSKETNLLRKAQYRWTFLKNAIIAIIRDVKILQQASTLTLLESVDDLKYLSNYIEFSKLFQQVYMKNPLGKMYLILDHYTYIFNKTKESKVKLNYSLKLGNIFLNIFSSILDNIVKVGKEGALFVREFILNLDLFENLMDYTLEEKINMAINKELDKRNKESVYLNLTPMEKVTLGIAEIGDSFQSYEEQEAIMKEYMEEKKAEKELAISQTMDLENEDMSPETGDYENQELDG